MAKTATKMGIMTTDSTGAPAVEMIQQAETMLGVCAHRIGQQERSSVAYAQLIRATVVCLELDIKTQRIAEIINVNAHAPRGVAARYLTMARWERGHWLKSETPLAGPVVIDKGQFMKPTQALSAGVASFTAVYQAFRAVVKPQVVAVERAKARARETAPAEASYQDWIDKVEMDSALFAQTILNLAESTTGRNVLGPWLVKRVVGRCHEVLARLKAPIAATLATDHPVAAG